MNPDRINKTENPILTLEGGIINGFEKAITPEGSFPCFVYPARETSEQTADSAPEEIASSAIVLGTVLYKHPELEITKKICTFLQQHLGKDETIAFFENLELLPPDTDTTAYVLLALYKAGAIERNVLERVTQKILSNTNTEGVVEIYFKSSNKESKVDPVALTNILHLVSLSGIESNEQKELQKKAIEQHLLSGEYLNGSRYYFAPEFFLYFLSQLIHDFPNEYEKWKAQVIDAITKRIGTTKYPIDLAMRITSMKLLGLDNEIDKNSLLLLQDKNGNFPSDCIYKYGSKMGYFGSQTISNAFCAEALTEENDML